MEVPLRETSKTLKTFILIMVVRKSMKENNLDYAQNLKFNM